MLARARHQHAAGDQQARDVGAEADRELVQQRVVGAGNASAASRSVAAASADPPPMPAATGTRLAIVSRCGGRPSRSPRGTRRARGPRGSGPSTPGQTTSSAAAGSHRQLVGERDRLDDRDQRVQAVLARRADEQRQVDLAGGALDHREPLVQLAPLLGRERLGARVGRQAHRRQRRADARRDPLLTPATPSARAPCAGARTPAGRARAAPARAPGRAARGRRAPSRRSAPG